MSARKRRQMVRLPTAGAKRSDSRRYLAQAHKQAPARVTITVVVPRGLLDELQIARRVLSDSRIPWSLSRAAAEALLDVFELDRMGKRR